VPTFVGLLRSVNVGGRKLPMAELREVVESLGFGDVQTFIQSGNVIFTAPKRPDPAVLEAGLVERFGMAVDVMLRSARDLAAALERNPFPGADSSKLHVGFMAAKPTAANVSSVDAAPFAPDELAVVGAEVYFHLPNGLGRAKLPGYALRRLKVPTTIRNWNTVTKLAELAAG
jgi:uncharacterized protein (DUF1697 family)